MQTLLWYDYETTGTDPKRDRISQFAALRTDEELNIIEDPINIFCQPSQDCLPNPQAILVTGVTPQQARQKGLPEHQFIAEIHRHFSQPNTCGVGYNSIRFDDEFTRYSFYRNFYDAYEREWKNGNSRWDIIDMIRLVYATRPDTLTWPSSSADTTDNNEPFVPSFTLEKLSRVNQLAHEHAHDALSDVYATIALAKLVKQRQPKLYDYCWQLRYKQRAFELINIHNPKPLLHISSKFPSRQACASVVFPIMQHPTNKNAIVVLDLAQPFEDISTLTTDDINQRTYASNKQLEQLGLTRFPVKMVHANRSPIVATTKLIDNGTEQRMQLTREQWQQHYQQWLDSNQLAQLQSLMRQNLSSSFKDIGDEVTNDPEHLLYDGFLSPSDKRLCQRITNSNAQQLQQLQLTFNDPKYDELLWRYRARNFPETLSIEEMQDWQQFCQLRLTDKAADCSIVMDEYLQQIEQLKTEYSNDANKIECLNQLFEWGNELLAS